MGILNATNIDALLGFMFFGNQIYDYYLSNNSRYNNQTLITLDCSISDQCDDDENSNVQEMFIFSWHFKIFCYFCFGLITVLATLGNGFVLWTMSNNQRMRIFNNYYIANLAFADLILALFVIPVEVHASVEQVWKWPGFMCSMCPFTQSIVISVSIYTMTAIAIHRQRVIYQPVHYNSTKGINLLIITLIWVVSIVMASPIWYAMDVETIVDGYDFCYPKNLDATFMVNYRMILMLLQYVIPLLIIMWAYTSISLTLQKGYVPSNRRDGVNNVSELEQSQKRAIKMMIMVVILFALCWFPLHMYNVIYHAFPYFQNYKHVHVIFFCANWLAMSNTCYNPFIYAIYNEKFKQELGGLFVKLKLRNSYRQTSMQQDGMKAVCIETFNQRNKYLQGGEITSNATINSIC